MLLLVTACDLSWWMVLLSMVVPAILAWLLAKQNSKDLLQNNKKKIKQLQLELKRCYEEKQIISTKLVKPEVRFSDPQAFLAPGKSSVKPKSQSNQSPRKLKYPKINDNLEIIEGIGPKMKEVLMENGIKTWKQLSLKSNADLKRILKKYGDAYRIIDPKDWPLQARLADNGRWEDLIKLQIANGLQSNSKAKKLIEKFGYSLK